MPAVHGPSTIVASPRTTTRCLVWWAELVAAENARPTSTSASKPSLRTRIHLLDRDRPPGAGGDRCDGGERLEEGLAVLGERAARLGLRLPEHDHHRVAAVAVDEVQRAGEPGFVVEGGD